MSIKEEGYLHDYIAAGLLGFGIGTAIGGAVGLGALFIGIDWGRVAAERFVLGLFGYLPGGFIAGYINFRLHKAGDGRMEGLTAGIIALATHFFITLFTTIFVTAIYSGDLGTAMGGWALSFVFALIFYPMGGYLSALAEEKTIPLPSFLRFQFRPAALPPPPPVGAAACPTCGGPLTYIEQYRRWYCYKCKKYT